MHGFRRPPKARGQYVADVDEIRPQYVLDAPDANALFASDIVRSNGASIASTINQLENAVVNDINSEWRLALPSYSDQVLPFNVTLAGANEYGAMCASKILGIEILNEGSGISLGLFVLPKAKTLARTRGRNNISLYIYLRLWHPGSRLPASGNRLLFIGFRQND